MPSETACLAWIFVIAPNSARGLALQAFVKDVCLRNPYRGRAAQAASPRFFNSGSMLGIRPRKAV
jgi:hypothetical protein